MSPHHRTNAVRQLIASFLTFIRYCLPRRWIASVVGTVLLLSVTGASLSSSTIFGKLTGTPTGIWLTNGERLLRVDAVTNQVNEITVLSHVPRALAPDVSGSAVWLLTDNKLLKYDESGRLLVNQKLPTIGSGESAQSKWLLANPYDTSLWLGSSNTLLHLDANGTELSRWRTTGTIQSLATGADGTPWVLTSTSLFHLSSQGAPLQRIGLKQSAVNSSLAIDNAGAIGWIANEQALIRVNLLDPTKTPQVVTTLTNGVKKIKGLSDPQPLAVNPLTGEVWTATLTNLLQYDRTGNLINSVDLLAYGIQKPDALLFESITQNIWLSDTTTLLRFSASGVSLATVDLNQKFSKVQSDSVGSSTSSLGTTNSSVLSTKNLNSGSNSPKAKVSTPVQSPSLPSRNVTSTTVPASNSTPRRPVAEKSEPIPLPTRQTAAITAQNGQIPLSFELNLGQAHQSVKFLSRNAGHAVYFTPDETVMVLRKRQQERLNEKSVASPGRKHLRNGSDRAAQARGRSSSTVLRMKLLGSNPAPLVEGLDPLSSRSNYLIGSDSSKWIIDVPHYARVRHRGIYSGVDQVFYGKEGALEYDLIVGPGADPTQIRFAFEGVQSSTINNKGDLVLQTALGAITHRKPLVYQEYPNGPRGVPSRYVSQNGEFRIEVGAYDQTRPLIIDPVIVYSTYLGGSLDQMGAAIAVGSDGTAYVTGRVDSLDFPVKGAAQGANAAFSDAFVSKLASDGKTLVYSTYLGGDDWDAAYGIAVDSTGSAYVVGETSSTNFPRLSAIQTTLRGAVDGFVTKLNAAGNGLSYSTYLGGNGDDRANAIALDSSKNAYITGRASSGFHVKSAYKSTPPSLAAPFVTKLSSAGALTYSTYFGGSVEESALGIAVDSTGSAYITGESLSPNFPTKTPISGYVCPGAYVTKFAAAGNALTYSTCISGNAGSAVGTAIALDSSKNAYVTGYAFSIPAISAYQSINRSVDDSNAFVTKVNAAGSALTYSTYLGGTAGDRAYAIQVDASGNAYIAGQARSDDFPLVNPLPASSKPVDFNTAFVAKLLPTGKAVAYSTYLGGTDNEQGATGVAIDSNGNTYATGYTFSTNFPVVNPLKSANSSQTQQVFVTKISAINPASTTTALVTSAATINAGQSVTLTATITGSSPTGSVTFYDGASVLGNATVSASKGVLTTSALTAGTHSITASYGGNATNASSSSSVVSVKVNAVPVVSITTPTTSAFFIAPATINIGADAAVSNGTITKVEFFKNGSLLNTATTSPYSYVWNNVGVGTYTLTAKATSSTALTTTSSPVAITVLAAPGLTVAGLPNGTVIGDDNVTVTGTVQAPANSSINVNGIVGAVGADGRFVVNNVPLTAGANTLRVTITTPAGQTTTQTVNVTSSGQQAFAFTANATQGLAPFTTSFILTNRNNTNYVRADVSCLGNSTIDRSVPSPATSLGSCTYAGPGLYTATVKVIGNSNQVIYTSSQAIQVGSLGSQDAILRDVYFSMMAKLKVRDINGALAYFTSTTRNKYNTLFTAIDAAGTTNLATVVNQLGTVQDGRIGDRYAEYLIVRNVSGVPTGFFMYLIRGQDGVWRIEGM